MVSISLAFFSCIGPAYIGLQMEEAAEVNIKSVVSLLNLAKKIQIKLSQKTLHLLMSTAQKVVMRLEAKNVVSTLWLIAPIMLFSIGCLLAYSTKEEVYCVQPYYHHLLLHQQYKQDIFYILIGRYNFKNLTCLICTSIPLHKIQPILYM